jgi:hypothetical protein
VLFDKALSIVALLVHLIGVSAMLKETAVLTDMLLCALVAQGCSVGKQKQFRRNGYTGELKIVEDPN